MLKREVKTVSVNVILNEKQFERDIFDPDEPERMAEIRALVGKHNITYASELIALIGKIEDVCYGEYFMSYFPKSNSISIFLFQD